MLFERMYELVDTHRISHLAQLVDSERLEDATVEGSGRDEGRVCSDPEARRTEVKKDPV